MVIGLRRKPTNGHSGDPVTAAAETLSRLQSQRADFLSNMSRLENDRESLTTAMADVEQELDGAEKAHRAALLRAASAEEIRLRLRFLEMSAEAFSLVVLAADQLHDAASLLDDLARQNGVVVELGGAPRHWDGLSASQNVTDLALLLADGDASQLQAEMDAMHERLAELT